MVAKVFLFATCLVASLFSQHSIDVSRQTVITSAIKKVGPSVACINVQKNVAYSMPDPFFNYFFPPEIYINVLEREPIAFASRGFSNNVEKGMIDIEGSWIPLQFVNKSKQNKIKLSIENWNPNKKKEIILIIKNRFIFQSPLQKIIINPLQEISLKTEHFESVLLGSGTDRLIEQINKLNQLQKSLPNLLINTKVKIVDLKDPTKPELKVERIQNDGR